MPTLTIVHAVQGAQEMNGLLDQPVQQHDFVTISRAAYTPGTRDWRLDVERTVPAVEGQHRDSATLRTYAEVYSATPGKDGCVLSCAVLSMPLAVLMLT